MIRNLKALGLALVAVFAFSAIAASGASAQQGALTAAEPVTLVGEETKEATTFDNALTAFPVEGVTGKTHCPLSTITGHKAEATPQPEVHELIEPPTSEITLTPHYKNCVTEDAKKNKFSTTVDMNGCDYLLTIGETTEKEGTYGVEVHIVCPEGKFIQVTLFSSSSHSLKVCTLTVTSTTPTSEAHVTNIAGVPDDLEIVGTFTNIHVDKGGLCGSGTDEKGVFHIDATVKGFNEAGKQIDVTVTD